MSEPESDPTVDLRSVLPVLRRTAPGRPGSGLPPPPGAKALFLDALERGEPLRGRFVRERTRGDAVLRRAVEELLRAHACLARREEARPTRASGRVSPSLAVRRASLARGSGEPSGRSRAVPVASGARGVELGRGEEADVHALLAQASEPRAARGGRFLGDEVDPARAAGTRDLVQAP